METNPLISAFSSGNSSSEDENPLLRQYHKKSPAKPVALGRAKSISSRRFDEVDEDEASGWTDPEMAKGGGRAFAENFLLGGGDEAEALLRTAGGIFTGDTDWKHPIDEYQKTHQEISDYNKKFAEEHPRDALVSSLAGMGASMAAMNPINAIESVGANTVGRIAPQFVKNSRLLKTLGTGAAFGAGSGALYDNEDRLGGAIRGGLLGGGASAIPGVVGSVGRTALKSRIAGDLYDTAGRFVPITLKEGVPEWIKGVYDIVGKSFNPRYREQVGEYLGSKAKEAEQLESVVAGQEARSAGRLDRARRRVKTIKEDSLDTLADQRKERVRRLEQLTGKKAGKLTKAAEAQTAKVKQQLEQEIEELDNQIRKQAVEAAMPTSIPEETVEQIKAGKPQDAIARINQEWSGTGRAFDYVKNRDFDINATKTLLDVRSGLDKKKLGKYSEDVEEFLEEFLYPNVKGGKISGQDLMEVRNQIGKELNSMGQQTTGVDKKRALKITKDVIDDVITENLDAAGKIRFKEDLNRFRSKLILNKVAEAGKTVENRGQFSASDYLQGVRSKQSQLASEGRGTLQGEVYDTLEQRAAAEARAGEAIEGIESRTKGLIEERQGRLQRAKDKLSSRKSIREEERPIIQRTDDVVKKLEEKIASAPQSEEAKAAIELKKFIEENKVRDPSFFTKLAATKLGGAMLGSLLGAGVGAASGGGPGAGMGAITGFTAGLLPGVALTKGMASPKFQRALLGSTELQSELRNVISKYLPQEQRDKMFDLLMRYMSASQSNQLKG